MIDEQEKKVFIIEDDNKADWALEKIRDLNIEIKKKNELADSRVAQIESWRDSEIEKLKSKIEWFEIALQAYAMKLKENKPDLKTHSLPFGKLQFRKQQPKFHYEDDKLIAFLDSGNYEELIKIKKLPDKKNLKEVAQIINGKLYLDGVEVDGVVIEERGESLSIKAVD